MAVVDDQGNVLYTAKVPTTPDITQGILQVLEKAVRESGISEEEIAGVMFGTTHGLNAIIQRRGLLRVGILRIGLPATSAIEPMLDWPLNLRDTIGNVHVMIHGGYEYTGEEIAPLDWKELDRAIELFKQQKVEAVAITGVFSPVRDDQEDAVAEKIKEDLGVPVSVSHTIGSIGFLERENATILNAAITGVMRKCIDAVRNTMEQLGIGEAKLYLAQNDGTIISAEQAEKYPIFTVAAAISNSVRGAHVLTGLKNAIVVDTGGTTTNVGVIENALPRESSSIITIGGVRTSFMMPDFVSVGIAGGSVVKVSGDGVSVGPESVGYELTTKGVSWGGEVLTATDVAISLGKMEIDDASCRPELAKEKIPRDIAVKAYRYIVEKVEEAIDRVKTKPDPMPAVLVGGGSAMLPGNLSGASEVIKPEGAQSANAIGAATALVGATVEKPTAMNR